MILSKIKTEFIAKLIIFVILFGVVGFLPSNLFGFSITLLRDVCVVAFVFILGIATTPKLTGTRLFATILILFCLSASFFFASFNGFQPSLVAPLYLRLLLYLLVVILMCKFHLAPQSLAKVYWAIYLMLASFSGISLAIYPFPIGRTSIGAMEGFSGQHFSKFVFVICVLFFLTTYLRRPRGGVVSKHVDLIFLCISIFGLVFILQRGAIIATGIGFVLCYRGILERSDVFVKLTLFSLIFLSAFFLFTSDRFLSYAFFESYGPKELYNAIMDGRFSLDMIRARGRLQMADIITSQVEIGFVGNGPGVSKEIVGAEYFAGREPHNDVLMFAVDLGVLGLLSVCALLLLPVFLTRRLARPSEPLAAILYVVGVSSMLGFFAWMPLSNVVIYLQYNFLISAMFILIGRSRPIFHTCRGSDLRERIQIKTKRFGFL